MNKKVRLVSFGYKYGVPNGAYLYYDVRNLPNPHSKFPNFNGLHERVKGWILSIKECRERIYNIVNYINNSVVNDMTIAVGCYGGKHRSVVVVEEVTKRLREHGVEVEVEHRELNK